jgi:hypothetical protein
MKCNAEQDITVHADNLHTSENNSQKVQHLKGYKIYRCQTFQCINLSKHEAHLKIFKNSVRTAKKTQHFTITKINWLTLFKEIIAVYCENHMKQINKNADLLIVKAGGTYSYHQASKG